MPLVGPTSLGLRKTEKKGLQRVRFSSDELPYVAMLPIGNTANSLAFSARRLQTEVTLRGRPQFIWWTTVSFSIAPYDSRDYFKQRRQSTTLNGGYNLSCRTLKT